MIKEYEIGDDKKVSVVYDNDVAQISKGLMEKMLIPALEKAEMLWGDDFDGWYERYLFNMMSLNDLVTKVEKYKWHDLRKNPNDLPKEGYKEILIASEGGSIWNIPSRMFVKYKDVDFMDIIKWKYIDNEEVEE